MITCYQQLSTKGSTEYQGEKDIPTKLNDGEGDEEQSGQNEENDDDGSTNHSNRNLVMDVLMDISKAAMENSHINGNKNNERDEEINESVVKKSSIPLELNNFDIFQPNLIITEEGDAEEKSTNEPLSIDKRSEIPGSIIRKPLSGETGNNYIENKKHQYNDLRLEIPRYSSQLTNIESKTIPLRENEESIDTINKRTTLPVFQGTTYAKNQNYISSTKYQQVIH